MVAPAIFLFIFCWCNEIPFDVVGRDRTNFVRRLDSVEIIIVGRIDRPIVDGVISNLEVVVVISLITFFLFFKFFFSKTIKGIVEKTYDEELVDDFDGAQVVANDAGYISRSSLIGKVLDGS